MISEMTLGFLLLLIIVVTPVSVAISAAMSFVSIPPVPRLEPRVLVLTNIGQLEQLRDYVDGELTLTTNGSY